MKGYILGAGPAGLIAAYYLPHFNVIGLKPEESSFSLGPRLLHKTNNMLELVNNISGDKHTINIEKIKIRYKVDNAIYSEIPENFKDKYVEITRKIETHEESHLSGGKSIVEHITLDDYGNESYEVFLEELFESVYPNFFIEGKVFKINNNHILYTSANYDVIKKKYDTLINTISLKEFCKLNKKVSNTIAEKYYEVVDLTTINKNFYKCEYKDIIKILIKNKVKMYDYMYSIDGDYTRKTFFKDYIVYETTNIVKDNKIEDNLILEKKENLPIQIKSSLCIENIDNIYFLGRYAQWNHKVKINEVLDRVIKLQEEIYG